MKIDKRVGFSMLLIGCLVVVLAGNALAATASMGGYSGLISIPTTDILSTNKATVGYQRVDNGDKVLFNYGVEDAIELGLTGYWYEAGQIDESDLNLNAKLRFMNETSNQPAVALGLMGEDLYVVASQNLNYNGIRGHVGVGNGDLDGVFAGFSKTLNPVTISTSSQSQFQVPITTLMAEYAAQDFNIGARFKFNSKFNFNIALEDLSELSAGLSFNSRF